MQGLFRRFLTFLDEHQPGALCSIPAAGAELDHTGVAAGTVLVLRPDLRKQPVYALLVAEAREDDPLGVLVAAPRQRDHPLGEPLAGLRPRSEFG